MTVMFGISIPKRLFPRNPARGDCHDPSLQQEEGSNGSVLKMMKPASADVMVIFCVPDLPHESSAGQ